MGEIKKSETADPTWPPCDSHVILSSLSHEDFKEKYLDVVPIFPVSSSYSNTLEVNEEEQNPTLPRAPVTEDEKESGLIRTIPFVLRLYG